MIKNKTKTTRVQLELPEKSMERLRTLKELTEASSYAEVIKDSLIFHERIATIQELGGKIFIEDSDGNKEQYKFIY